MLTFAVIDPMLFMFFVANIGTVHFMTQCWVLGSYYSTFYFFVWTQCWVIYSTFYFLRGPNVGL